MVRTAQNDVVVFTVSKDERRIGELRSGACGWKCWPRRLGRVPLGKVLDKLGEEGILTVMTETGTRLNTGLLAGGLVDRVQLFVSPQLWGRMRCRRSKAWRMRSAWAGRGGAVWE